MPNLQNNKVQLADGTPVMDITDTTATESDVASGQVFYKANGARGVGTGNYMDKVTNPTTNEVLITDANGQAIGSGVLIGDVVQITDLATETTAGLIKLNPNESIDLNASGQLDVGGRLGQMSSTNGIFHPKTADPRQVGNYSFMITDAKGLNMTPARVFGILTGYNQNLTGSHPAGSTSYTVANTYENRIRCSVLSNGGFIALSEADAVANRVTYVQSVTINGQAFTPNSSADDSSKPITITVGTSVNPDSATSTIRMFGAVSGGYCSQYIGQDVGGASGVSLIIGQNAFTKSGNGNVMVGLSLFNNGNGNSIFGRYHISTKNRWLMAGSGHDNTNGRSEAGAAVGQYSDIDANTLFAVGNGTSATARSNAFEVLNDGIVLKSPNGTRYKIAVSNTGAISATKIT